MSRVSNPAKCRPRLSVVKWLLGAALTAGSGAMASAQTIGHCYHADALGANTQLRVSQQEGRALIEIARPNSGGRRVEVDYGDELYSLKFGADNKIRISFALTAAKNDFGINISEAPPVSCSVDVPEFAKLFRVILRWHDPVQLDLNVLEPGGRMGEFGHVNATRTNNGLTQGLGQMDVLGVPAADGATSEMSDVVANGAVIPPGGEFTYKVEYVTRGLAPDAPYCENHPLAAPQFDFITIQKGEVVTRKMSVNRARCNEKIADSRRLMPIRY